MEETNDTTVHDDVIDDVDNRNGDVMNNANNGAAAIINVFTVPTIFFYLGLQLH